MATKIIEIHALAPNKPPYASACNGCGVCCAAEPCPVAFILLMQFNGSCGALEWQVESNRYVCGLVGRPDHYVWWIPKRWRVQVGQFVLSRIASGIGCDSDVDVY